MRCETERSEAGNLVRPPECCPIRPAAVGNPGGAIPDQEIGDRQGDGGRLRLLRNGTDIEDYIAEVPPDGGTFIAFKRSDKSWHGHLPFEGERRYVMFNWVRSNAALTRNVLRHKVSASIKRLNPFR